MTIQQRPLNTQLKNLARDGAQKRTVDAAPVPGMKRQSAPSHEYLHGAPLRDEPSTPIKSHEKPIEIHSGMTGAQKAKVRPDAAKTALESASRLGKA